MLNDMQPPVVLDGDFLEDLIASALKRQATPREIAEEIVTLLSDRRVSKAISHPIRRQALSLLRVSGPLSPVQIAQHVDGSLGTVSYHVRALQKLGVIELVGTRPRRGALEHIYALAGDGASAGPDEESASEAITIAEAADIAGKTTQTIRNWIAAGRLTIVGHGPTRVNRRDLFRTTGGSRSSTPAP